MADGEIVTLKKIDKSIHPYEADIALYFSSEPQRSDPHNHCVPIYEVLSVPNDPDKIILVTPMFRKFDDPRFDTVGEAVEFFRQAFQVC